MTYTARDIANGKATVARLPEPTRRRAAELATAFPQVKVMWGDGPGEHSTGRALDLMVAGDRALGDKIADYLWTHRARLGLTHVIWYRRIRSTVKSPGVWRAMENRGSPTENHEDHVHALFDQRAYTAPPKPPTTPKTPAYPGRQLSRGSTGAAVLAVQRRLKARGWAIATDGKFGPAMERVIRQFQANKNLRVDGVVGPATWAALWALPVT